MTSFAGKARNLPLEELMAVVEVSWGSSGELSSQSVERMVDLAQRFLLFAQRAHSVEVLADIDAEAAREFIAVAGRSGLPSAATQHLRRSTIRLLFRTARQLGLVEGDPTLDIVLPARTGLRARPLDDAEVALCRSYSHHTLTETRLPGGLGPS